MNAPKKEKIKLNKAIGSYIRERRLTLGLSQQKCAKRLSVHAQFLYAVERGKVGCPLPLFRVLIKELKLERVRVENIYGLYWATVLDWLFH